jgi:hypothetical protein
MANWSKRTSRKNGNTKGSRTTRTYNSNGGSTTSYSKRVGNAPRSTTSITNKNGKTSMRTYTTEYHPTLGRKVTQKTIYASSNAKPKKPKKVRTRRRKTSYRGGSNSVNPIVWLHVVAFVLLSMVAGWLGVMYLLFLLYLWIKK